MSNSEMRIFCVGQGRTRVCGEAYSVYVATGNPRRTRYNAKKTIYGWTLTQPNAWIDISIKNIDD